MRRRRVTKRRKKEKHFVTEEAGPVEIDETDILIVRELLLDARQSYHEIARKIGKSAVTVMKRVKYLEAGGVIKKYSVILDCEKIGFDIGAIINLRISKGKLFMVEKKIAASPNVTAVYDNTGDFDATVIAKFRNRRGLDNFLKKIQTYDFVERTETRMILNTIKEDNLFL